MSKFAHAMTKHFRLPAERQRMPVLVKTRRMGRNAGRKVLARVLNDVGVRTGIEIGTWRGESALQWCEAIPGLRLTCIDPYAPYHANAKQDILDQWYKEAQETFGTSGHNIDLWRMSSRDAVLRFEDASVDFVYIDGDHTFDAVMMDLLLYAPKVKQNGIVVLHDYFRARDGGVVEAVDAYTRHHLVSPWYVTYDFAPTAFWQRNAERT